MTWLVVGGAGYIGSHIVRELYHAGQPVVVVDDLSTGCAAALPDGVHLEIVDACDAASVGDVLQAYDVSGVIHLAALKHARESVASPLSYWRTNLGTLLGVLEAAEVHPVQWLLLSSSCSVYGSAGHVSENTPLCPESPYAHTKVASEALVRDWATANNVAWAALRYFNVVGSGDFPFASDRSSQCIVPAVAGQISRGESPHVFGGDFDTPDGSALRDYLDVRDLAQAHRLVAEDLALRELSTTRGRTLNVGTGHATSVFRIVELISQLMGWSGSTVVTERRPGDPDRVWAAPSLELVALGWAPRFDIRASITSHIVATDTAKVKHQSP